jgi:hypothetical protein
MQQAAATMTLRRSLIAALLAAAAAAFLATSRGDEATVAAPAAEQDLADDVAERLAAVERVVAERNRSAAQEQRVFEADGWEIVSAPPPDPRVTDLDPSLLAEGREHDLRHQIGSTTPQNGQARRIAQILVLAKDEATRESAALALGRIRTAQAQEEILNVLSSGKLKPDDLGRSQLAALLRPVDLDDEIAARMADLLDSQAITGAEKEQVAFSLGLVGLRDGMELPDAVLATMSPEARALLVKMKELGAKSFLAHGSPGRDVHHHHSH